jgi:hypothetical protein
MFTRQFSLSRALTALTLTMLMTNVAEVLVAQSVAADTAHTPGPARTGRNYIKPQMLAKRAVAAPNVKKEPVSVRAVDTPLAITKESSSPANLGSTNTLPLWTFDVRAGRLPAPCGFDSNTPMGLEFGRDGSRVRTSLRSEVADEIADDFLGFSALQVGLLPLRLCVNNDVARPTPSWPESTQDLANGSPWSGSSHA